MSNRVRRWLVAVLAAVALIAPLPAVRAVVPVDLGGGRTPDLASSKLGEFLEELRADPAGLHYEMLLSVDGEAAARAVVPAGRPLRYLPHVGVARTVLDREEILQVARSSVVEGLEPDRPLELLNAGAREATGVETVQHRHEDGTYGGLTGAGIHVAVIDTGLDTTHPDFAGRIEHAWEVVSSDPEVFVASPVAAASLHDGEPKGPKLRAYVGSSPSSTTIDVDFVDRYSVATEHQTPGTDNSGHGTHVTGTLAGGGHVEPLARGVAPAARIHSYKFAQSVGPQTVPTSFIVESFDHVLAHNDDSAGEDNDIRVVNMSVGSPNCTWDPGLTRPSQKILRRAYDGGVLVTVAYGNSGPAAATCTIQSMQPWVLGVANGERGGRIAGDSSRGVEVGSERQANGGPTWVANYDRWAAKENADAYLAASGAEQADWPFATRPIAVHRPGVTAPGSRIVSTMGRAHASTQPGAFSAGGLYGMMSGTSMAAPHAAGIATLVVEAFRDEHGAFPSPETIIEILEGTADPHVYVTAPVYENGAMTSAVDFRLARQHEMGRGYVDAVAAVAAARAWTSPEGLPPARHVPKTKSSTSFPLGECAAPVAIGSYVSGKEYRTCAVAVPEGVQVMRIVATPKPGDVVAVSVSEDRCVPCREQSSTIINTSKPVTGKVYDVAVRRPRPGPWTVRFDGTAPGPGAPTAVTPLIPYEAVVTFEFGNRRPAVQLQVMPATIDRAPVADIQAAVSDPDGVTDLAGATLVVSDAAGRRTQRYEIERFVTDGEELRLDLPDLQLQGAGPWTVRLSALDTDGADADQTIAVART